MNSSEQATGQHTPDSEWTLGRLLHWTTDFLKQRGSDSPQLDAQLLLAHARNCQRIELFTAYDEPASETLRAEFRDLVRRRAAGEPVAYLVGHREFYSMDFQVSPAVLIPRPETEFLVIAALDLVKKRRSSAASGDPAATGSVSELLIADVGTGSGILAACLARHLPQSRLWAIDADPAALQVARQNCTAHGVSQRVEFCCGDLLTPVPAELRLDLIVSNPPYVSEREYAALAVQVRDYEPRGALVAGATGTEVIERLIPQAAQRLKPGGTLLMEISPMIEQAVYELLRRDGRFIALQTHRDLAGQARVVQATIPL